MNEPWLLIDSPNIAWRAAWSTGDLSYNGKSTGVMYGFLREVLSLQDRWQTNNLAFCFDRGPSLRRKALPTYKAHRTTHLDMRKLVQQQLQLLGRRFLPGLGYQNIFSQKGYEADDLIADLSTRYGQFVIVSSDQDFYQLLSPTVIIYNPRSGDTVTAKSVKQRYGLDPNLWAWALALSGCSSDNIKGIKGVGFLTAQRYLRGELPSKRAIYRLIEDNWNRVVDNYDLVRLPLPGVSLPPLRSNKLDREAWQQTLRSLGMVSLLRKVL